MNIEKIETNRLYLRPFTKDDALFAISIWNDPEMGEYLGDPALETIDPEYVKEIEALGDDPICCYLIAESKTTGERIGTCSFIPLKDQTVYDIAYCVNKLHWRKGYATEMIQRMIPTQKHITENGSRLRLIRTMPLQMVSSKNWDLKLFTQAAMSNAEKIKSALSILTNFCFLKNTKKIRKESTY